MSAANLQPDDVGMQLLHINDELRVVEAAVQTSGDLPVNAIVLALARIGGRIKDQVAELEAMQDRLCGEARS